MPADNDDVLVRADGGVGFLTLNRPRAINSLTHPMVTAMSAALTAWADNDEIGAVVLDGAGDRGLCAGGDVVAISAVWPGASPEDMESQVIVRIEEATADLDFGVRELQLAIGVVDG